MIWLYAVESYLGSAFSPATRMSSLQPPLSTCARVHVWQFNHYNTTSTLDIIFKKQTKLLTSEKFNALPALRAPVVHFWPLSFVLSPSSQDT